MFYYIAYEYDTKEIIDKFVNYTPKGHEVIYPNYGLSIHNLVKMEHYSSAMQGNALEQRQLLRYTYEYDEKGLPKKSTRYINFGGDEKNTVFTYTFACQ